MIKSLPFKRLHIKIETVSKIHKYAMCQIDCIFLLQLLIFFCYHQAFFVVWLFTNFEQGLVFQNDLKNRI